MTSLSTPDVRAELSPSASLDEQRFRKPHHQGREAVNETTSMHEGTRTDGAHQHIIPFRPGHEKYLRHPPRPIAVWVLVAAASIYLLGTIAGTAFWVRELLATPMAFPVLLVGIVSATSGGVGLAFAFAAFLAYRRHAAGRILGLCVIALYISVSTLQLLGGFLDAPSSADYAFVLGQRLGGFVLVGASCIWFYCFGFTNKAKEYFGVDAINTRIPEPGVPWRPPSEP